MNIHEIRAEMPHIANGYVHLNHAGVTPVSSRVVDGMANFITSQAAGAPGSIMAAFAAMASCREKLAKLMGVEPQNLALTKNTAHGVSIVANGFKWNEGDEIVFADCEYPANSYPWLAQEDRGVKCVIVSTRPDGTVPVEDYRAAISPKTRLIAVSWVQFSTGWRNNLADLVQLAHEHNAKIFVDVIQGLGALPINLTELGVDFAATGSQKWLIGPLGVGGLYIKPDVLDEVRLVNVGALSVPNVTAFDPLGFTVRAGAQRYEEGTPNVAGIIGLEASLTMLLEAGAEFISEQIRKITDYAAERLEEVGYEVKSPRAWVNRAGIVLFSHPSIPNETVMAALESAMVNVVARGGKVRFAPHFYNTLEDIDRAIEALPKA